MREMLESIRIDLMYAARVFRRAPLFTGVAFVTLVAGIASVTTIFSYMNAVYYAPLPYANADRIVAVGQTMGLAVPTSTFTAVKVFKASARSFERIVVFSEDAETIGDGTGDPRQIRTLRVDTSFFQLFALRAQVGRMIAPDEINGGAHVAVISDQLWRTRFGADPSLVGRMLDRPGRTPLRIVGVLPVGFRYPYQTDLMSPLASTDARDDESHGYAIIAKLRPGVSKATARAEVSGIAALLPESNRHGGDRFTMLNEMLDRRARQFFPFPYLFLGTALFVLLIACSNVANLYLARAAVRAREMAVRAALGASPWRLIRQALTETLLLGAAATSVGVLLSGLLVKVGLVLIPTQGLPSWFDVSVDYRVLAFGAGVSILVTLAVGILPAREGTRPDVTRALKDGDVGGSTSIHVVRNSKKGLALQLALAVSLSVTSALFVRSYFNLTKVDFGYPADQIAVVQPLFDQARYPDFAQRLDLLSDVAARALRAPAVRKVALQGDFLEFSRVAEARSATEGRLYDRRWVPDGDTTRIVRDLRIRGQIRVVSDNYFSLLGLALTEGRGFTTRDFNGGEQVAVISAAAARLYWPDQNPLGHTIREGAAGEPARVIGVVENTFDLMGGRNGFSSEARPIVYLSVRQAVSANLGIVATGAAEVRQVRAGVLSALRSVDPNVVLMRTETMASMLDEAFLVTKVFGGLMGAFSVVGLLLAVIGIYGVVSFGVARRTREIGIRVALGATRHSVIRLIVSNAIKFVGLGGIFGTLLALGLGKLLRTFLFGVSEFDPVAYVAVSLLFGGVALLACYVPAHRAASVDPLIALRSE
jgi:putative ABC transport system permease protein